MDNLRLRFAIAVICILLYYVFTDNMIDKDALKYYENRRNSNKTRLKIYDIGHKYIQDLTQNNYARYICDVLSILTTIIAYFTFSVAGFTELIAYQISIFIFRFITINLTILPPNKTANNDTYTIYNYFLDNYYDHQFSGHMTYMILFLIMVIKYNITWLLLPSIIGTIIMAVLLLATRVHYTIDIILSVVVSLFFILFGIKVKL